MGTDDKVFLFKSIFHQRLRFQWLFVYTLDTLVAYHLHGQTGRFSVWTNGKQISVLGNSFRNWRLRFAEIPTIYTEKNWTTATANENISKQKL